MTEDTGRILWTNESKNYLLRLIRENPIIISPNVSAETMQKKEYAWQCIEKCFASDGMVCQLGKIKRLWKRMKVRLTFKKKQLVVTFAIARQDNARQNTMKAGEQRRRGIKHVRPPSDLDWQVHQLLATRNVYYKSKEKKKPSTHTRMQSKMTTAQASASCSGLNGDDPEMGGRMSSWPGMQQHPLQHSLADSEDDCDDGMAEDDDDGVDLVDLLTPLQPGQDAYRNHQQRHRLQQQDALEPVTIIEEMMDPIKIEPSQDLTLDDDDDVDDGHGVGAGGSGGCAGAEPNDEYTFHHQQQQHSDEHMTNGCANEEPSDNANGVLRTLKRNLLMLDIQLRQTQRQYENERLSHERQLFRKRTQLLDLQIRRAQLEVRHVQQTQLAEIEKDTTSAQSAGNQ